MNKTSWKRASQMIKNVSKDKKMWKKIRSKNRRKVKFGEEKSFEKSIDAWDII